MFKKITVYVTIAIPIIILIILGYDAVAILNEGTEASISSLIIIASHQHPLIPAISCYFFGLLSGHLWWRMAPNKDTIKSGIDKGV
jgi:hypothetical protein